MAWERGLLWPAAAHYLDTGSDIALMIEWYNLMILQKNENPEFLQQINMSVLFYSSVSVFTW